MTPRLRTLRRGQHLRTIYPGRTRDQIFRLREPVKDLGNERGGHWWVTWLMGKHVGTVLVDSCVRVKLSELRRRGLVSMNS